MTAHGDTPSGRSVLICSGLDPSGGAGFVADTRTVSVLGARPVGVVTALTVQNTAGVHHSQAVDAELVGAQLAALLGDVEVHAVKLGLLGSLEVAREISRELDLTAAPVVWDPIGAPSRGAAEFDAAWLGEALRLLSPHLRLITPNALELAALTGKQVTSRTAAASAARELAQAARIAVLVKGGHLDDELAIDVLVADGTMRELEGPRIPGGADVHGTGCALSSAIAAYLAGGAELFDACRDAKRLVASQIAAAVTPGRGAPAVM